jgi:hypothetical protein
VNGPQDNPGAPWYLRDGWPVCDRCRHPINPRSETCVEAHPMCSPLGCDYSTEVVSPGAEPRDFAAGGLVAGAAGPGTSFLIDIASYQAGLNLGVVRNAGFSKVNIKLTQGNWYTYGGGPSMAAAARALGMDVIGFHWLDNTASGADQARYCWAQAGRVGVDGIQLDCEDSARPATWQIIQDFTKWMQDTMGRHLVIYTGDWWWRPRGYPGASLTPYVWAAPNAGYQAAYPGDTSASWTAGYGGWSSYALLQYAVSAITGAGGGNLSKTAIREPGIWAALTGRTVGTSMEQTDKVVGSQARGNTVGDVLADDTSMRDWLYGRPGDTSPAGLGHNPPPAGSRLDLIFKAIQSSGGAGLLSDAQLDSIATALARLVPTADQVADKVAAKLAAGTMQLQWLPVSPTPAVERAYGATDQPFPVVHRAE